MANRIEMLCTQEDVDGIFVSIPSSTPLAAIQKCLDLNIPVVTINAGATELVNTKMHHIGMSEFNAGKAAGEYLINSAGITHGLCINHAQGVHIVEDRCSGFSQALNESGVEYIGQAYVPDDNEPIYVEKVEEFAASKGFPTPSDWDGLGILTTGGPQHIPAIALQARHPGSKIGAFDTSPELYAAIDAGIKEFGVDQQAYLQGYMPIVLLTYAITTGQTVANKMIESGPAFLESSPSDAQQVCEDNLFLTCEEEEIAVTPAPANKTGLIVGLVVLAIALMLAIIYFAYCIHSLNKHVAELKAKGQDVPPLTTSQVFSSFVNSPNKVVGVSA